MKLRRIGAALLFTVGLAGQGSAAADRSPGGGSTPHIVYILADDLGYGDLSCLNPEGKIPTPHLDRLAREGMIFSDAHSASAVCTPTRYALLTGRYCWRSVLKRGVAWGGSPALIEPGRATVGALLQLHGYTTGMIGKWHLGWDWAVTEGRKIADVVHPKLEEIDFARPVQRPPNTFGFDHTYAIIGSLDMAPYVYVENGRPTAVPTRSCEKRSGMQFYRAGPIAPDFVFEQVTPNFCDRAARFVTEHAGREEPFFLYLALPSPHTPILPTPEWQGRSGLNPYGDFVMMVDHEVGKVLKAIREAGLEENTLVVFTSDNGCSPEARFDELHARGHRPSHVFRGAKADLFEGGHRIPFLVRWPGVVEAGSRSDALVCGTDFLATCADLLGEELPAGAGEDSFSMLPLLRGRPADGPVRTSVVHHSVRGEFAIRRGKWKLLLCPSSGGWSYPAPGRDDEVIRSLPRVQLYDLERDIGEQNNLAEARPEVVEELRGLLAGQVRQGRSTPGAPQANTGPATWKQLRWMEGG